MTEKEFEEYLDSIGAKWSRLEDGLYSVSNEFAGDDQPANERAIVTRPCTPAELRASYEHAERQIAATIEGFNARPSIFGGHARSD